MTRGPFLAAILATLPLAGPLGAQGPASPRSPDVNRRVFIDVNQTAPETVLRQISTVVGCQIVPAADLSTAPITVRLWNVRARTALDAICEMAGCRWHLDGRLLRVDASDPPPPIPPSWEFFAKAQKPLQGEQWRFDQVPFRRIVGALAGALGAPIAVEGDYDPTRPTSIDLNGRDPLRALGELAQTQPLAERSLAIEGTLHPGGPVSIRLRAYKEAREWETATPPARILELNEPGLTAPVFVSGAHPRYTREAMQAKIQGKVVLSCVVATDGSMGDVRVVESLDPGLDARAVEAAKGWTFKPGTKGGKPVPVRISLEMQFHLR